MIKAVNVVQHDGRSVMSIHSWEDNQAGNKKAEEFFTGVIKEDEPNTSEEDINACLDNGFYEQGIFNMSLAHSEG